MNHQPFEDWLFDDPVRSGRELGRAEQAALHEHLDGCEHCRQLSIASDSVDAQLRAAPSIGPAPGFTARWQARLELELQRLHRRQSLLALMFTVGAAALLFGALLILALPLFETPTLLLVTVAARLLGWLSFLGSVQDGLAGLLGAAANLPVLAWVLLAGVLSQIAVLWLVTLRYFTNPRRVTK
jgi:hypothetical protein